MEVKRMSKNITQAIQKNIKPISNIHLLPLQNKLATNENKNDQNDAKLKRNLKIQQQYTILKENARIDHVAKIKIISCLKLADHTWKQYLAITNKNGQTSAAYLQKLKKIDILYVQAVDSLLVTGSLEKIKKSKLFLQSFIATLQQKSRRYYQHENKFKVLSKAVEDNKKDQLEQEEEIKEEMIGLVEQFKKYAVNIQEDLIKDAPVIDEIGRSQDNIENSLKNKSDTMKDIINEQKIGFFKLIFMGIIAALMWIFGLFVVIIT